MTTSALKCKEDKEQAAMECGRRKTVRATLYFVLLGILLAAAITAPPTHAEYGDVVINNHSDRAGMRPAVFPHWFHRIRFRCSVCHADLGFQFKAGGNDITMLKIIDGQFCGACHNGNVAWSIENCELCHSGKPKTPTQVHESTLQKLLAPVPTPVADPGEKK